MDGGAPEPVVLILADISGYTRYMTANAKTLAHSHTIITELIVAIVRQAELPFEIAKLEGDAVFFYCRKQNGPLRTEAKRVIGEKLLTLFRIFSERVTELSQSNTCACNACMHIDQLRLKVIVHSGEALFHRVVHFLELAGLDVIIAHRLLKNSIAADQYLLVTEAARSDLEFSGQVQFVTGAEDYADVGRVTTLVCYPNGNPLPKARGAVIQPSFGKRFLRAWKLYCKLWFSPLHPSLALHERTFRHITSNSSRMERVGFAVLTFLLSAFFVPVGVVRALFQAVRR
jgi:class 3 adenylate cyclase